MMMTNKYSMLALAALSLNTAAAFIPISMRTRHSTLRAAREGDDYVAVMVVPTGIGASIGGFAGDAMPAARVLASVVDKLVTHPNVMNGASLYWPESNILYVEGYGLDQFAAGSVGLRPVTTRAHRIGLVLDVGMSDSAMLRHLQVANAARGTLGVEVSDYVVTDEPLGVELAMTPSGASWGTMARPDALLRAAKRLVVECGCTALALVAEFPDDEDEEMLEAYRHGVGVDAVGGVEAIISHLVTSELGVPCAHAPALPPLDVDEGVSPRACAEELGYTFLPCVLANLRRAPFLVEQPDPNVAASKEASGDDVWASNVKAVVVPSSACGGSAVLSLSRRNVLLVVVEENETTMKATPEVLGFPLRPLGGGDGCTVLRVRSYLEAAGVLAAHRAGIMPAALTASSSPVKRLT